MDQWQLTLGWMLAAAVVTVAAVSFRIWFLGIPSGCPPVLRHVAAYFLAYLAAFVTITTLPTPWLLPAVAAVMAPAIAVSIHGREPLLTRAYAETTATTFAVFIILWIGYELLRFAGFDLFAS